MAEEYLLQMTAEEIDQTLQKAKDCIENEVTLISVTEESNGSCTIVNQLTNGVETITLNVDSTTKIPTELVVNGKIIKINWQRVSRMGGIINVRI